MNTCCAVSATGLVEVFTMFNAGSSEFISVLPARRRVCGQSFRVLGVGSRLALLVLAVAMCTHHGNGAECPGDLSPARGLGAACISSKVLQGLISLRCVVVGELFKLCSIVYWHFGTLACRRAQTHTPYDRRCARSARLPRSPSPLQSREHCQWQAHVQPTFHATR